MKKGEKRKHTLHLLIVEIVVGVIVNLLSLAIFFKLGDGVFEKETAGFDQAIIHLVYQFRNPVVTEFMKVFTAFGGVALLGAALAVAFIFTARRHSRRSILFISVFSTGVALNLLLKNMFHRPRPAYLPLVHETSYSFPSGHAMNSFIFYMLLAYIFYHNAKNKKLGILVAALCAMLVFLIGLSRVYLGAHYPSDVIAGYFGGLWWIITVLIFEKLAAVEHIFQRRKG